MSSQLILAGFAALIAITLAAPEFREKMSSEMQAMMTDMNEKIAALSPNARTAAEGIRDTYMNAKLSKEDKMKKKMEIVAGLSTAENAEIQSLLKYYMDHYHMSAVMKDIETRMAALSPNANEAAQKIHGVMTDMTMSKEEKMKKKDEVIMALKEPEQIEVKNLVKYVMDTYPEIEHYHGNSSAMLNGENSPMIKDENIPMMKNESSPMVNDENSPMIKDENSPMMKNESSPMVNDENSHMIKDENSPMMKNESNPMMKDENSPMMKDMETRMKALSPNAGVAAQKIHVIMTDMTMSKEEKTKKADEIIMTLKDSEQTEVKNLMKYFMDTYGDLH